VLTIHTGFDRNDASNRKREDVLDPYEQLAKCQKVDCLMSRQVDPLRITAALKEASLSRSVYDRYIIVPCIY
jgi:hypothetical protein